MRRIKFSWLLLAIAALLVLIAYLAAPRKASGATSTLTGTIKDSQGNPLNGSLAMQLPVPAQDTATNTAIANTVVRYTVVNGVIQSGPPLYDVAGLQPANLYYVTKIYDSANNLVMAGNYVVTGASFNLGAATPSSITTSNISYVTPVTTGVSNTFTQAQSFPAVIDTTTPPSVTGFVRIASADSVCWRNAANSGDLCLAKNGSDVFSLGGTQATLTIASGTATMTTALIASLACGTTVTVSAANVATTDAITWSFNAGPAANPGELAVSQWPTAGNVNFQYCNPTAGGVTPNAATLNWRVTR